LRESFPARLTLKERGYCREEGALFVEQIVAVLKEAELGTPAAELIRKV
jgi:hypothetical protein